MQAIRCAACRPISRYCATTCCADHDRFLDALTAAKTPAGVKNTAMAFGSLLDSAERNLAKA